MLRHSVVFLWIALFSAVMGFGMGAAFAVSIFYASLFLAALTFFLDVMRRGAEASARKADRRPAGARSHASGATAA